MEFNDKHKVIVGTLNRAEAKAFIKFLQSEIIRHVVVKTPKPSIDKA